MLATPTPTPAPSTTQPTMCLRHGDYHVMDGDCWAVTLDWYVDHQHLDEQTGRNAYLAEVERRMLDNLLPKRRPAPGSC